MFKKKNINKNKRARRKSDDEELNDKLDNDNEEQTIVQRKYQKKVTTANSTDGKTKQDFLVAFNTSGSAASLNTNTATRTIDVDGGEQIDKNFSSKQESNDDGIYRGTSQYTEYVNKKITNPNMSSAGKLRAGPLYAPTNVRIQSRMDYAVDVCKDYKETGFCGFGDSCVFVHDRGDYKSGWELDKEWDKKQKEIEKARIESLNKLESGFNDTLDKDDNDDHDGLPDECQICCLEFNNPVVSSCKHYFCEKCALEEFAKSPKCFVCKKSSNGMFKPAKELLRKANLL